MLGFAGPILLFL